MFISWQKNYMGGNVMQTDYQKIRGAIEKAINFGKRNFIIYPYGEYGVIAKQILNDSFGIMEDYIVDNKLSVFNPVIKSLDFFRNLADRNRYTVIFTCANPDMYNEVLENLEEYFEEDNIVKIFELEIDCYEVVQPHATYAPWRKQTKFMKIYEKIKEFTLVDLYRCFELWSLLNQTKKCISGDILEVGVYKGGTGALLASATEYAQIQSDIFLCDTFKGVVKTGSKDNIYKGGEHSDTSVSEVENLINCLNLKNVQIVKGIFPDEVLERFTGKKYRFVHIDVDSYQSAKDVFNYVWQAMEIGGIVVFDDYGFAETKGVAIMLEEIHNSIQDGIFVGNINGHGIFIKIDNKSDI